MAVSGGMEESLKRQRWGDPHDGLTGPVAPDFPQASRACVRLGAAKTIELHDRSPPPFPKTTGATQTGRTLASGGKWCGPGTREPAQVTQVLFRVSPGMSAWRLPVWLRPL